MELFFRKSQEKLTDFAYPKSNFLKNSGLLPDYVLCSRFCDQSFSFLKNSGLRPDLRSATVNFASEHHFRKVRKSQEKVRIFDFLKSLRPMCLCVAISASSRTQIMLTQTVFMTKICKTAICKPFAYVVRLHMHIYNNEIDACLFAYTYIYAFKK